ncbi:MAG: hypothetical protein AB7K86_26605 [Rhodospirillales bacterium]
MSAPSYAALYRRTEMALPGLVSVLVLGGVGTTLALVAIGDSNALVTVLLWLMGLVLLATLLIVVATYRAHRWTIEPGGVRIEERPKVPLCGPRRRALLRFADIAGVHHVESGLDTLVEIAARDGRRFRMGAVMGTAADGRTRTFDHDGLAAFAAAIRTAASASGHPLHPVTEGLSFWNRPAGIGFLALMFAVSLLIAATVAWALWDGWSPTRARNGEMVAIALLLPAGAGWLLHASLRRRRAVLAMHAQAARPAGTPS